MQTETATTTTASTRRGGIAADQLRSIVERVERIEEERAGLASDIRDVFAEARGNGFDVKTIRRILKLRRMDASDREEAESLLELYGKALGMQLSLFA